MFNLRRWAREWLGIPDVPTAPQPQSSSQSQAPQRKEMRISDVALADAAGISMDMFPGRATPQQVWTLPKMPQGVMPHSAKLAMDSAAEPLLAYALSSQFSEGITFLGYPYLAELSQRAEYRRPVEIMAKAMTSKWIKLKARDDDESKTGVIKEIERELERLCAKDAFRILAEQDGFFGRSHLFLDFGTTDDEELKAPCPPVKEKIAAGSLLGLKNVEAMWVYPNQYNANDPLKEDFFKPTTWFVMGQEIHATRLMTVVSRPMPDILKPVYGFGGMSLTQLLKPYVDNWLRVRQSVTDVLLAFSTMVLKTDMSQTLNGGSAQQLFKRVAFFNRVRNNRSTMVVDKEMEDLTNVAVPLGTLDALQAQSQEHMASAAGIPLIILFAITPTGLNASSDSELKVFADWVKSQQEATFTDPLKRLLHYVQLNLYGDIDRSIGFEFVPLSGDDVKAIAEAFAAEADTDAKLIEAGVIAPEESRQRIATQDGSPYAGLDTSKVPKSPEEQAAEHEEDMAAQYGIQPPPQPGDPTQQQQAPGQPPQQQQPPQFPPDQE